MRPGVATAFAWFTATLADDAIDADRLCANERALRKRYAAFPYWPSDAQLALHIMAWFIGPGFNFPALRQAVNRLVPDFRAAAEASAIPDRGHPGVAALNSINSQLFATAHRVLSEGWDGRPVYCARARFGMWV
jgi:hypothetical protein